MSDLNIEQRDWDGRLAAAGLEDKDAYTAAEIEQLKKAGTAKRSRKPQQDGKASPAGATSFPHPAQAEQPETTALDIGQKVQSQGDLIIQHKIDTLSDAQKRGTALANEEAVTELAAYVNTAGVRRAQLNEFMGVYRNNLDTALSELAPEVRSAEDADFFGQPPQFSTQNSAGSLKAG